MHVQWYGQSAFLLRAPHATVVIDPIGDVSGLAARGITFDYPAIAGVSADLVLVTHEHADHNGVEAIGGSPVTVRSMAGTFESPIGDVVAIASEHDPVAGTERGPNTIVVFDFDGSRVAHFGDFGQSALRDEQAAVLGQLDGMFVPIGGGFTIGAQDAAALVERVAPRWVVPMHYRTHRVNFLEEPDAFLERVGNVHRLDGASFDTATLPPGDGSPLVVVPQAP